MAIVDKLDKIEHFDPEELDYHEETERGITFSTIRYDGKVVWKGRSTQLPEIKLEIAMWCIEKLFKSVAQLSQQ